MTPIEIFKFSNNLIKKSQKIRNKMSKHLIFFSASLVFTSSLFAAGKVVSELPTIKELFRHGYVDDESVKVSNSNNNNLENEITSVKEAFERSRRGDVKACYYLGLRQLENDNLKKAFEWFDLANLIHWFNTGKMHVKSVQKLTRIYQLVFANGRSDELNNFEPGTFRHIVRNTYKFVVEDFPSAKTAQGRYQLILELQAILYPEKTFSRYEKLVFITLSTTFWKELVSLIINFSDEDLTFKFFNMKTTGLPFVERTALREKLIPKTFRILDQKDVHYTELAKYLCHRLLVDLNIDREDKKFTPHQYVVLDAIGSFLLQHRKNFEEHLGLLYHKGLIGRNLPEAIRERLAVKMFEQGDPVIGQRSIALINAINLLKSDFISNEKLDEVLAALKQNCTNERARSYVMLLLMRKGENDVCAFQEILALVAHWLKHLPEERGLHHTMAGFANYMLMLDTRNTDEECLNYARDAEAHLLTAHSTGFLDIQSDLVRETLKEIKNYKKLIHEYLEEQEQTKKALSKQKNTDETFPLVVDEVKVVPTSNNNNNVSSCVSKQSFEEKTTTKERKADKRLRATLRHKAAIKEQNLEAIFNAEKSFDLTIEFYDSNVEKDFKQIDQNKKVREIFNDIMLKPWGLNGAGKPEIIRFGRFKGCYSRRIDSENRLVYRVKNNTIEIVSCKGHYDL